MNFLAHFHIASSTQTSLTGALLGEFVRGQQYQSLPVALQTGIKLHRKVDVLSEHMPHLVQVRQQFGQGQRRYLGIVTDMLLDYQLSRHWQAFHPAPLEQYTSEVYLQLRPMATQFPNYEQTRIAMTQGNWLGRYGSEQQILHALKRISLRLKRHIALDELGERCLANYSTQLEAALFEDYPALISQASMWLHTIESKH